MASPGRQTTPATSRSPLAKVCGPAVVAIAPLVAAAWLPPGVPHLLRQVLLCAWGVGVILIAERVVFHSARRAALSAAGFVRAPRPILAAALLASAPMWASLPLLTAIQGVTLDVRAGWAGLIAGVVLVNGITEEVIHRGFVFGHLRHGRSFAAAATLSAAVFSAQHLYLLATMGWMVGLASVALAACLAYPLAFAFERGDNSIAGPAMLHTSSNAPAIVLAVPEGAAETTMVMHMGVVLVSMYLVYAIYPVLAGPSGRQRANEVASAGRPAMTNP